MEPVLTHRAKTVVDAARLHRARFRKERGQTLVEGPDLLRDVMSAGAKVVEIYTIGSPSTDGLTGDLLPIAVSEKAMARLAGTASPRGPVAVVEIPEERLERGRNLVVSVGVSDPGNVGTMIRTAASFGWGFAYMEGSADPWSPKAIRAGAGGQFRTAVFRLEDLQTLQDWTTVAAVVSGGVAPGAITQRPVALLVGEEAHGLDPAVVGTADQEMTIPTSGAIESLNAAIAAGIAVYALSGGTGEGSGNV